MIRILHMSDIHNDVQARIRSAYLAEGGAECDVVALTGDFVGGRFDHLPEELDYWPQRFKFSVPGNHDPDSSSAFSGLKNWRYQVPWHQLVGELLFVGIRWGVGRDDHVTRRGIREYLLRIDANTGFGTLNWPLSEL